ncbi:MAG: glycosyltransferase family 4 protein [Pseudomonadota bacterium]
MSKVAIAEIEVLAPNFKRRLSGVTATVVRLVPEQAQHIAIAATGPTLPAHVPQVSLGALLRMSRQGPGGRPRVWHARRNTEMLGGLALKYLLGKRLKLMFTSASQRSQTGLTRWLIRRMDAVVATSEATAQYLEVPAEVIMHGIDLDGFAPTPDRAALRRRLGLPDAILVGCYGRIRRQKGTDAFYGALAPLMQRRADVHAVVMGRAMAKDQELLTWLKRRTAEDGIADRFHFRPEVPVEKMADWYQVLDLYVAPQRWEGFGLTPIEAMACGVPVVATRVGAFEQIVTPQTGALVPPDDIEALGAAVAAALAPAGPLMDWRQAARPHVTAHFRIDREAEALIALYRRLLNAP